MFRVVRVRASIIWLAAALGSIPLSAIAEGPWVSEVELGVVLTSGNTEEEILKLRVDATRESDRFKHNLHGDSLRNSRDGKLTAQKLYTFYKADYKLDREGALFGRISYEDDRFSGFDYQADATVGYTRMLRETDTTSLEGDLGIGARRSVPDTGPSDSEAIVRIAAAYSWQVSENAVFKQLLSAQIGSESTISRSETSLQTTVTNSLAMKLALTIRNNSEVPVGRENTDTETSVTLVYKF